MDRRIVSLLVLLFVSGMALSIAAYIFGIFPFDLEVAAGLKGFHHPLFVALMGGVSYLGDRWIPLLPVAVITALCCFRRRWVEATFVVATLSAILLAEVLKVLVGRPRPPTFIMDLPPLFKSIDQYAYPSGHVLLFVVFYGFMTYLSSKYLTDWVRSISISICISLIVLIGPSRIVLGDHWMSDVMGSYIIGAFWLIILILLYQMVLHRRKGASTQKR